MSKKALPRIRKKLSNYIKSEKGKISKQSMVSVGAFIGTAAIASSLASKNAKAGDVTGSYNSGTGTLTGEHDHY